MSSEITDRRVRKTRKLLRECLISLLKEKKVQEITVRELTDMADLNRGTFYLHYKDVYDLLEKTEEDLRVDFYELFQKHDANDLRQRPAVLFKEIYTLVYDNADLIEILIGENGDLNFVNHLKKLIQEKCLHNWMEVFRTDNPVVFDAFCSFIVSGCVGMVQYWLQTGLKETPGEMAGLTEVFITKGINVLEGTTFYSSNNTITKKTQRYNNGN